MNKSSQGMQIEREAARPITFSCRAPDAKAIFVAGAFNDWRADAVPLKRQADGLWQTTLRLSPGHQGFKFVVDGQWCCESGCEGEHHGCPKCCANDFGTMNRVLEV